MNVEDFLKLLAVYVGGVITTIAVFRAKFIRIDDRFEHEKKMRDQERTHDKELLEISLSTLRRSIARAHRTTRRIEHRQQFALDITMDIANKLGLQHRKLPDFQTRATHDEDGESSGD